MRIKIEKADVYCVNLYIRNEFVEELCTREFYEDAKSDAEWYRRDIYPEAELEIPKLVKTAQNGKCPNCGSNDLNYDTMEPLDYRIVFYPFTCNNCGAEGKETWGLTDGETVIEE